MKPYIKYTSTLTMTTTEPLTCGSRQRFVHQCVYAEYKIVLINKLACVVKL